ncbi:hypothetical protein HDU79_002572 [Rhizoclosmatium sp. JEL0117]|nr:hypothetical protein HDU79_002572 [Rhizoclosmatium sp. JEL0117]
MISSRAQRLWNPSAYLKFSGERLRPALDLLSQARITLDSPPRHIIDLGCGTGNITPFLRDAWPESKILCLDSSVDMLKKARESHSSLKLSGIEYQQTDFEGFQAEAADLIFSNAALHWVSFDVHKTLIPRLMSFLRPGGVLAFQIPDTRNQPSHLLMTESAKELGFGERIKQTRWVTCERDARDYYGILSPHSSIISMWHTRNAMILDGDNPVADFTASTGLGPYVDALGGNGSEDGQAFIQRYRENIAKAYPKEENGKTIFEFNRFYLIAKKSEK